MAKKLSGWKTKGMNRDLSVSAFNPEFAFENRNLRLATNENNTTMSWVNERGTMKMPISCTTILPIEDTFVIEGSVAKGVEVSGIPIGTAIINHQLVLFTTLDDNKRDRIYVLWYDSPSKTRLTGKLLFQGNLNFSSEHPLETLVSYEAENIQKVYWVDGVNQARLINIMAADAEMAKWYSIAKDNQKFTMFDFVNEMKLQEAVLVKKILGASGMFAPGVIQYAFTYYKKYGQETNIFYTTPLYYISHKDRGASPEDKVDNAFKITVTNVDKNFDYLRIYSIHRTSINSTPMVKRIQDIDISKLIPIPQVGILQAVYTDTGVSGDSVDPMELLFKGGRTIIPNTLEQKDNTLFFGNFSIEKIPYEAIKVLQSTDFSVGESTRSFKPTEVSSGSYQYYNQLTSLNMGGDRTVPCGGFKTGDYYRLGVQFQYKTGEWSSPVYLTDYQIKGKPQINGDTVTVPCIKGAINLVPVNNLMTAGYKKIRPVVVFPEMQDRMTICQGVIAPTMYTENKRNIEGGLSAQSSWFFRTNMEKWYPDPRTSTGVEDQDDANPPGSVAPYIGEPFYTAYGIATNLKYTKRSLNFDPKDIRMVEIQGDYKLENQFAVDRNILTFHSPDIEFDTKLSVVDLSGFTPAVAGSAEIIKTVSDIDIQTETPTISNKGAGFVHKSFKEDGPYGIVSGLFYDDKLVDDTSDNFEGYTVQTKISKFMVYLWNKNGSLNNDFNRPTDKGVQSAKLKKKIISNLRYANTYLQSGNNLNIVPGSMQLFSSDDPTILRWKVGSGDKAKDRLYMGNIDTLLTPDHMESMYFCLKRTKDFESPHFEGAGINQKLVLNSSYADMSDSANVDTPFNSTDWWRTYNASDDKQEDMGLYRWNPTTNSYTIPGGTTVTYTGPGHWEFMSGDIGTEYSLDLNCTKEPVRMKYKSTPHYVFELQNDSGLFNDYARIPIVEIKRKEKSILFGGTSDDALKENIWIPCGEPVFLGNRNGSGQVEFEYSYGDTYYQRWDCLKTYAFTPEDINQVVEIGSFMLETRVNIDGRYDRNRGQISNLYMSPQNFNLLNPIYSQVDNFFTYRIQDERDYENTEFPNQVTWSKTKTSGADVDLYTNVIVASVLEMDGDKGEVRKLIRFNDQLLSFQDKGISQVLYNENMQMSTTEGVPIEIANSGEVNGKRYITDSIGCSNKWSIVQTPSGIYFMDSINKAIFIFNGQVNNLSGTYGFNTWCKKYIPSNSAVWNPRFPYSFEGKSIFTAAYDKLNQDVLFISRDTALAFSEKLGTFTSFYDYGSSAFFCNLDDTGIWVRTFVPDSSLNILNLEDLPEGYIFKVGDAIIANGEVIRCVAETTNTPYTFVVDSNGSFVVDSIEDDKVSYVVDNRVLNPGWQGDPAAVWKHQAGDYCNFFGADYPFSMILVGNPEPQTDKIFTNLEFRATVDGDGTEEGLNFTPSLPFDYLETWNEYQHGMASLANMRGHSASLHHTNDGNASLKRKFRMWRCDIPRDNVDAPENNPELNIYRMKRHPMDRMRNPWLYIKLLKEAASEGHLKRTEVHDIVMTYFN